MKIATRTGAIASVAVLTFALAACSPSNEEPAAPDADETTETVDNDTPDTDAPEGDAPAGLSGSLNAAGASAQESAMEAWRAGFQSLHPDVTVNYDSVGSGGGRTQFLEGATSFAGSDSLMGEDEYALAVERCVGDEGAIHLPMYISPVAIIFNLDGIDSLNLDADTIADIFNANITSWDDAAIADQNPDVDLPSSSITIVHRSDESGTTDNFTDYLEKASSNWGHEASGDWMGAAGESGPGTSAVVQIVQDTQGAIGYADASRAGTLGTVAVKVGDEYVPFSPEAAAKAVEVSPLSTGANGENDLAFELDRTTTEPGAYPIVLVSYDILCQAYEDPAEAELVSSFLTYVASAEGQQKSAEAAGSSPISPSLSERITEILAGVASA